MADYQLELRRSLSELDEDLEPRFFWRIHRSLSASPQQTADSRRAEIYYPLHPLFGQAFWIRERRRGPPATYLVATESSEVFTVPVWMTQPAAANLRHES